MEMISGNIDDELPEADEYVLNVFFQLGICNRGGMSICPLSWSELKAFSELNRCDLSKWEAETVIMMSRQYCLWYRKGVKRDCSSPWFNGSQVSIESNRIRVANAMKAMRKNKAS